MVRSITIALLVLLVVGAIGGFWYFRTTLVQNVPRAEASELPQVSPDDTIIAGPVTAVSNSNVTVLKQDGKEVTLKIGASTRIVASLSGFKAPLADVSVGKVVLITPNTPDSSVADSIIIVARPAQ